MILLYVQWYIERKEQKFEVENLKIRFKKKNRRNNDRNEI